MTNVFASQFLRLSLARFFLLVLFIMKNTLSWRRMKKKTFAFSAPNQFYLTLETSKKKKEEELGISMEFSFSFSLCGDASLPQTSNYKISIHSKLAHCLSKLQKKFMPSRASQWSSLHGKKFTKTEFLIHFSFSRARLLPSKIDFSPRRTHRVVFEQRRIKFLRLSLSQHLSTSMGVKTVADKSSSSSRIPWFHFIW